VLQTEYRTLVKDVLDGLKGQTGSDYQKNRLSVSVSK
jgi:hypothetical protein